MTEKRYIGIISAAVILVLILIAAFAAPPAESAAMAAAELTAEQRGEVKYCAYDYVNDGRFVNLGDENFVNALYSSISFFMDGQEVTVPPEAITFDTGLKIREPVTDSEVSASVNYGGRAYTIKIRLTVGKAPLRIITKLNGADSLTIDEGETYGVNIEYDGFLGSDGVNSLDTIATVDILPKLPTAGYTVVADNASSTLYEIIYVGARLIINANPESRKVITENGENKLILTGSFSPNYTLEFSDIGVNKANVDYVAINEKVERYYLGTRITEEYRQIGAYKFYLRLDGEKVTATDPVGVQIKLDDRYTGKKEYRLIHFTDDGIYEILAATESDGYLNFNTVGLGEYVLLVPIEGASPVMIAGLCVGGVAAIILVVLLVMIFRRKY